MRLRYNIAEMFIFNWNFFTSILLFKLLLLDVRWYDINFIGKYCSLFYHNL